MPNFIPGRHIRHVYLPLGDPEYLALFNHQGD